MRPRYRVRCFSSAAHCTWQQGRVGGLGGLVNVAQLVWCEGKVYDQIIEIAEVG